MCVCVSGLRLLTQQVLHALSRLDDLSADRGAADAVQDVISFGDNLHVIKQKPVIEYKSCSYTVLNISATVWSQHNLGCFHLFCK